jgi:D-3-phosphoglycerate dehydrogenase
LINGEVLNHITDQTPILINTSRGFILNEEDVIASLQVKKLSGLGVDVISDESNFINGKPIQENGFWCAKFMNGMPVTITPHIGGATLDSMSASSLVVLNRLQTLLDV